MLKSLEDVEPITWFNLGLFLDGIHESRQLPDPSLYSREALFYRLREGIAFVTYDYGIDGVSIEIAKYARALEKLISDATGKPPSIYCIGETIKDESRAVLEQRWKTISVDGAGGFVDWDGYMQFFHTRLARGSKAYNALIRKMWDQVKDLTRRLGSVIMDNNIQLLIPVNACSNPGNMSLTLSLVLLSEFLSIPVISNNHDFYWEEGGPSWWRIGRKRRIRDHFFTNAHIGEVFSLVENLFPWNSPLWYHTVLNNTQLRTLIYNLGYNPATVATIPTVVDTTKYRPASEAERHDALKRLELLLSGGRKLLRTRAVKDYTSLPEDWYRTAYPILLGHEEGIRCNLKSDNLLFLQPTRILKRKGIPRGFYLIEKLLKYPNFKRMFDTSPDLTITLLVTGPVTREHVPYVEKLMSKFREMLSRLAPGFRERVFLACRFGIETNPAFDKLGLSPLAIHEIYGAASLVLLPSEQEGRGLPIIESAACGVPIMTNRYDPPDVFSEVVGESLDAGLRLNVLEFPDTRLLPEETLERLTDFFSDPDFHSDALQHNIAVVVKRFSEDNLIKTLEVSLQTLAQNMVRDVSVTEPVARAYELFRGRTRYGKAFRELTLSNNRKYLPGITKLEDMVYLKSLIDPSFFRMEEKYLRGRIFQYAHKTLERAASETEVPRDKQERVYRQIQYMFEYHKGERKLVVDHSLSYRHRHNKRYFFRDMTEPELRGIAGILLREALPPGFHGKLRDPSLRSLYTDMTNSIRALVGVHKLGIDHSSFLADALRSSRPVAWFPGISFSTEAIIFVERALTARLGMSPGEALTAKRLARVNPERIGPVTLFVKETYSGGHAVSHQYVVNWFKHHASDTMRLLHQKRLFRIVKTAVLSDGTHLGQLGARATKALLEIKRKKGFVVSVGINNMLTSDLLDMDRYHVGICGSRLLSNFMGVANGQGFVLAIPAGLRASLAYPTPIQTPWEFAQVLDSKLFRKCCRMLGEKKVLRALREDADRFGTPIRTVLQKLLDSRRKRSPVESVVESNLLTGLNPDGSPWSGAYARALPAAGGRTKLTFTVAFSKHREDTVLTIARRQRPGKVLLGWNGGYILNPELVGKLGLPEDYIGSPLGLLIRDGKLLSLPLYNKPALAFDKRGVPSIREANLLAGVEMKGPGCKAILFSPQDRNNPSSPNAFFDLMYPGGSVPGRGRTVYRFSGSRILEVLKNTDGSVQILPVGITVSMETGCAPKSWRPGARIAFRIPGWEGVTHAVEAGPRLMRDGRESIEMAPGGWKTEASIRTQAARVDYTHMRGPKIGVGLARDSGLVVVAINGRIRESEGATHSELATILAKLGAFQAMGFDPGGSVTLVVDGKQLNISPYNKDFLVNPISLPPQPRFVGNAVLGVLKK